MRKIQLRGNGVSLRFVLLVGALLVAGVAALAYFALTPKPTVRRHDPKAVMPAPPGVRPKGLPSKKPEQPPAVVVKHPKLSTPLATLARAVPQDSTSIPSGEKARPPVGFSIQLLPKSVRDMVDTGMMRLSDEGYVQVYIQVTEITDTNLRVLESEGAKLELRDERLHVVQARVPANRLEAVAGLLFVKSVRLPDYGIPNTGSITTEGDIILNADQVRALFGVDGSGVRVGVISDGIGGIFLPGAGTVNPDPAGPVGTADLPATDTAGNPTTGTRDATGVLIATSGGLVAQSFRAADSDLEAGAEGTAMLEIVHDLAPGAELHFANFETGLEFNAAVSSLAQNTDVVVDDIAFFGLSYDGNNPISANTGAALNDNANPVRAHFTSVGNHARKHYQDTFVDSGIDAATLPFTPPLPTGNLHLFSSPGTNGTVDCLGLSPLPADPLFLFDVTSSEGAGSSVEVWLVWDDPFGASGNDYDLYLVEVSTGVVVASSTDPQTGSQNPVESLAFTNTTGSDGFFDIIIQNFNNAAAPVEFDMFVLQPDGTVALGGTCTSGENHNFNTVFSSVPAQSDTGGSPVSVMSLGAIDQADPLNDDIEDFSSNGPTNDARLKPDASAIDGVLITGAGGFGSGSPPNVRFFGTSAAAPHGSGVAALLLQMAPCLEDASTGALADATARQTLRDLILNNAVDLGAVPGPDQVFGFGRIDALASAPQTLPTSNAGADQLMAGNTATGRNVTLDGTGSSDPTGCPLTFNWTGGCGTAGGATPTVPCPFGVNTVNLNVTNNGVTVIGPDTVQVTVTDFAIAVNPPSVSVNAGQRATYTVDLTPLIDDYNESVSLSCSSLPTGASCSFSPASATPGALGGGGVSSTLTVSTTAPLAFLGPLPRTGDEGSPFYAFWLGTPLLALLGSGLPGRKSRKHFWLLLGLLIILLAFQVACGDGGGQFVPLPSTPPPPTPSGTHTFTITGTNTSLQHSVTADLVVN